MSTIKAGTTSTTAYQVEADTTGDLVIATGASANVAMTVNSSGNIGIGTSSPTQRLSVYSSGASNALISAGNGTTGVDGTWFGVDAAGNGIVNVRGAYPLIFSTNALERARIDSSGNLGLGVTPSAWASGDTVLQVKAGSSTTALWGRSNTGRLISNAYYDGTNYKYVATASATSFETNTSGGFAWQIAPSGTAGNAITFTQAMTLSSAGQLGIGETSPTYRLEVKQDGTEVYTVGRFRNSNSTALLLVGVGGSAVSNSGLQNNAFLFNDGNSALSFGTNATERARITAGGYSKFSNDGTYYGSTSAYHEMRQTAADTCVVLNATNASFASDIIYARATRAANSAYNFFTGNANGVDQIRLRGDGVIYAQNTTVQSISDARLKENVRNATEGLNVVNALRPVRYDWKPGFGNDRKDQLGFIAQEIETVFPEAVSEWKVSNDDQEAYKTVGPGALIPVLVKAIQEQQAMIDELKAKVAALKAG
jgi:hypothetical protein